MWPGGFPSDDYVRQVRRRLGVSQRGLAAATGVGHSTVTRIESGGSAAVRTLERLLAAAGLVLVVVEAVEEGDAVLRMVPPLREWDRCRDGADRRTPAPLPLVLDPRRGEWWGDAFGLVRPPETYYRSALLREIRRQESRWTTRHDIPVPRWPLALRRLALPELVYTGARAAHREA